MNKIELKPYKGFIAIPRGVVLPFIGKPSHLLMFGVFIAFVIECDWFRGHKTYGCLVKSNAYLANRWGCNTSTVWRYKEKLLAMGLFTKEVSIIRVKHFELFEVSTAEKLANVPLVTMQDLIAYVQNNIANRKEDIANTQNAQVQNGPQSFSVSSKSNLSLSQEDKDSDLSEEDINWIDENIS